MMTTLTMVDNMKLDAELIYKSNIGKIVSKVVGGCRGGTSEETKSGTR